MKLTCGKRRGQNDERPILSLSLSDYSINGASYKPSHNLNNSVHSFGNVVDESVYVNSNLQKMDSSIPLVIHLQTPPGRVELSLQPPPGGVGSSKLLHVNVVTATPSAAPPPPLVPPPAPKPPTSAGPPPPHHLKEDHHHLEEDRRRHHLSLQVHAHLLHQVVVHCHHDHHVLA